MLSTDGKIHFCCNECGTKFVATPHQAGKPGNCKNCGSPISVPFLEEAEESKTVAEEEVKVCPECGNSLKKDARFCDNCGASTIQNTIPKAAQIKREETWDSTRKKNGLMKYFYAFLFAVFVIGIYFKSPALNKSTKSEKKRHTVQVDASPEMQAQRANFIENLKKQNIIYKVEVPAKYPHVYVKNRFYGLSIDEKKSFISVIAAYYLALDNEKDIVVLYDWRSGKQVGKFSKYGLDLD